MLKKRIIPCLDVKDGYVVKGINFLKLKKISDPVEQAQIYQDQGADELCFLDISASNEKRSIMIDIVKKTADRCFMPLTVGGGIKDLEDIRNLLKAGADKISLNTFAVNNLNLVEKAAEKFGNQCIVVAIDVKKSANGNYTVFTHGGRNETKLEALSWAKTVEEHGAGEILLTSMDRDGTGKGFDIEITKKIADNVSIPVIASGGVGKLEHLVDGVIKGNASGVLAASIFHYGTFSICEAKKFMKESGVLVRL
ncbi:MAG: imidazole glycerol phosphate synthase subunit HisF [Rhodospirillaceae bacterium]|nr:imidazole glycerol phosphate synthase subunit HisF [Rhodospirillaceae bacterium]|tara:strand:+ start:478 stop:1236 length:759 start_codon:yes stop_codon:yes gene_type:complete